MTQASAAATSQYNILFIPMVVFNMVIRIMSVVFEEVSMCVWVCMELHMSRQH